MCLLIRKVFALIVLIMCTSLLTSFDALGDKPQDRGGKGSGDAYQLISLPDDDGSVQRDGYASAINNQNMVAGGIQDRAYCWQLDGENISQTVPLAWPADPQIVRTESRAVNETGAVVGFGGFWDDTAIPLVWVAPLIANVAPLELPAPQTNAAGDPFAGSGIATNINGDGLVTGWLRDADPDGSDYVVVWKVNLDPLDELFGSLEAGPVMVATSSRIQSPSINDNGNVVATIDMANGPDVITTAWRWKVVFDAKTMSLYVIESELLSADAEVHGINERDDVCGVYYDEFGAAVAYIRASGGLLQDLPALVDNRRRGTRNYSAYALDDGDSSGMASVRVVGGGLVYDKRSGGVISHHHLLWQASAAVDIEATTDFGNSDIALEHLRDVNNNGWIVPSAEKSGIPRAVVLIPLN